MSFREVVIGWLQDGAASPAEAAERAAECAQYGCASGVLPEVIRYSDNAETYDQWEDEILSLCQEADFREESLASLCTIVSNRVWCAVDVIAGGCGNKQRRLL